MNEVPALPGIIAKLLVMIDQTLGVFASVTETAPYGACGITAYNVQVSDCGNALIATLADIIYYAAEMAGGLIKSLQAIS